MQQNYENTSIRISALIITTLASFLLPFMISSVNIALPAIAKDFNMSAITMGWVVTSYILSAAVFLVPFGRIADIYGRKRIFVAGMLVYTLASFLLTISNSSIMLIISRILQGLGGSMNYGTAVAILTSIYPPNQRGKVLGINVSAVYLGLSVGPTIGGILTQAFGWRSIFAINVPIGLAISIASIFILKGEWAGAKGEKFDLAGSIIFAGMLVALMHGFSRITTTAGILETSIGIVLFVIFVLWESKSKYPILDVKLFKGNKTFTLSNLAALINYSATWAVTFLLSLYLQYIKVLSPRDAGLVLLAQPIVQAVLSPFSGRMSDYIEPRIVASIGMGATAFGLILFSFIDSGTSIYYLIILLVISGFGFALFSAPNMSAIMGSVEKKYYGVASGMVGTMRMTGQMMSMGIVMLIFTLYIGGAKITPENYDQFLLSAKMAFKVFSILCILGMLASLSRGKIRQEN
ncbi:TPA: MFS transporter [bacterium]|nr:MFS transporter [bacterium]